MRALNMKTETRVEEASVGSPPRHQDGCECAECADRELEDREAAFERRDEAEHFERGEPNKYGERK